MNIEVPQGLIGQASWNGIVPGVTISCAIQSDDKGIVPPTDEWKMEVAGAAIWFTVAGLDIYIRDWDGTWATVITPPKQQPMDELKITKGKVLEAAGKHPGSKETLKTLFPEAFEDEPFEFGREYRVPTGGLSESPFCVGLAGAPDGLNGKCLMLLTSKWDLKTEQYGAHTILTFHKKK